MIFILDFADMLDCLLVFFPLNHSHLVNFLFCYLFSLIDGHAVGVYLKWPIFIKIFLEENLIWQCRLILVLHSMFVEWCV